MPLPPGMPSFAQVRQAAIKAAKGPISTHTDHTPPVTVEGKDTPKPRDPHMESRQAYFPYRGVETHGVPSPAPYVPDAEGYTDGLTEVRWDEDEPGGTVLDVRVISDAAEQIRAFRTLQYPLPANTAAPLQIVSRNRARTKITFQNMSAVDGCLIGGPSVSATTGYYLAPGANKELSTTEEVWGISNTANSPIVSVIMEYTQDA